MSEPADALAQAHPDAADLFRARALAGACRECGAPLGGRRTCLEHLHDMLGVEWQVSGGVGEAVHMLAVGSYNLQHPSRFTVPMLEGLRRTVADVLEGRVPVSEARRRAREATDGPTRVRRREGTPVTAEELALLRAWPREWELTVAHVSAATPETYVGRVREWARSVVDALRS